MSLTLIISFGRHGDYPWQWLLRLVTPFAISALPILGGILCLSAPVSGRIKAQLVDSILFPAVPWLWLLLEAMKSAHISSFYSTSDFLLATPVLAISTTCFTLFVQHFVTAIDRSDFASMARTLTISLTWLSAVSICGLLGFEFLHDGRLGSPIPGMAAFLLFSCACVFQLWTFAFASFLKTLRLAISKGAETSNRQKQPFCLFRLGKR